MRILAKALLVLFIAQTILAELSASSDCESSGSDDYSRSRLLMNVKNVFRGNPGWEKWSKSKVQREPRRMHELVQPDDQKAEQRLSGRHALLRSCCLKIEFQQDCSTNLLTNKTRFLAYQRSFCFVLFRNILTRWRFYFVSTKIWISRFFKSKIFILRRTCGSSDLEMSECRTIVKFHTKKFHTSVACRNKTVNRNIWRWHRASPSSAFWLHTKFLEKAFFEFEKFVLSFRKLSISVDRIRGDFWLIINTHSADIQLLAIFVETIDKFCWQKSIAKSFSTKESWQLNNFNWFRSVLKTIFQKQFLKYFSSISCFWEVFDNQIRRHFPTTRR